MNDININCTSRRGFLKKAGIISSGFSLAPLLSAAESKKDRINLLFIMTDQQRWDALSIAGNKVLKTPNLDRLAEEGVMFKNAYTPCPVCGPARTSILTGCTLENTKVRTNGDSDKKEDSGVAPMKSFDEILGEKGYWCEYYGKWHSPVHRARVYKSKITCAGKDSIFGPNLGNHYKKYLDRYVPIRLLKSGEQYDTFSRRPYRTDPIDTRHGLAPGKNPPSGKPKQPDCHGRLEIPAEHSITAMQAKDTMKALEKARGKNFSITCSFHYPHAPMLPTEPYYSLYPAEKMNPPESINDPMKNSPYANSNKRAKLKEYRDKKKIRYMISNYYGLVKEIDDWVGKILDKLKSSGREKNTLVIFTSDHGEMLGSHGMREKNVFYEESAHIPLIMRLPGAIKPNTVVNAPVSLINLFATILDYLKAGKHPSDGYSLRGLIEGTESEKKKFAVIEWNWRGPTEPNLMIRISKWKYICTYGPKSAVIDAFYNLESDPHEMNNLIGKNPKAAKYEKIVKVIKNYMVKWLESVNYPHVVDLKKRSVLRSKRGMG